LPQVRDRLVDGTVEVYVRARTPDPIPQLVARDDVAGRRHEHRQDLKRLLLDAETPSAFFQLAGAGRRARSRQT
jgi:hypothetical protein